MLMGILNYEVYLLLESLLIPQHVVYLKSTVFTTTFNFLFSQLFINSAVYPDTLPFILTIAWCNPVSLPINIIHTCFSKRSQALGAASLPILPFKRELSAAVTMPYNQNNSTANNATTAHSHSNSNSSASSQNVRRPLNLRLSLQHLLICFLNRPRKARATHHPLLTGPANGKPSHEPGLTEALGSGRGPQHRQGTGQARASRTTKWQHG